MRERITAVHASLSEDQARQLKAFLSSRRPFTEAVGNELARLVDASEQAKKPRMTTCESCSCGTPVVTCTEWVWNGTRWSPVVVYLKSCGFWERVWGCLFGFLSG